MRENVLRYLNPVFKRADKIKRRAEIRRAALLQGVAAKEECPQEIQQPEAIDIPAEFNGKDYVTFLLHINAEIEHGLMLQYLYAAYSIGGPQVPEKYRDKVRAWQEIILGVAKEEMGHFISVQNVLRLIGGALNFGRQDYPWDTPFYPYPFKLEPFTLESLAKYVYAESPEGWIDSDAQYAKEIKKMVHAEASDPHRVGALFEVLMQLIMDREVIPDEAFQSATYPYQAKFDEWGRSYTGGQRGNATGGNPPGTPNVFVMPLATRDNAYNALSAIAEQGEASTPDGNNGAPSHFDRFLKIYGEMKDIMKELGKDWKPSRNVAVNPYISSGDSDGSSSPSEGQAADEKRDAITNPEAQQWAHLFNLRYRLLLNYLSHSFNLEGGMNTGTVSPRGTIINATFGEMYNLRSIATVLVQTPLGTKGDKMAGPPFMIPYTLDLPYGEHNRWRQHKDVLLASEKIIASLLSLTSEKNHKYLYSLREADQQMLQVAQQLVTPAFA